MTASAFYSLAALILIAPHTSATIAKVGTVFFLFASLIALAIEHSR